MGEKFNIMAYLKWNALIITNAAQYSIGEAKALIKEFRDNNPKNEGLAKRSDKNYLNEWAVHAFCYRLGIMKSKAKDACLQFDMEPEVRFMYNILGPFARLFLKLFKH